jgi:hypothetical protein
MFPFYSVPFFYSRPSAHSVDRSPNHGYSGSFVIADKASAKQKGRSVVLGQVRCTGPLELQ